MSCEVQRQEWQDADEQLQQSIEARSVAIDGLNEATDARIAAEAAEADAANKVALAEQKVARDSTDALEAYQDYLECINADPNEPEPEPVLLEVIKSRISRYQKLVR